MEFNIGNLVSSAIGAVVKVATAVIDFFSPAAEAGGGLAGMAVGLAEAVMGAVPGTADVNGDGEIDADEAEVIIKDVLKVMLGGFIGAFGCRSSESDNQSDEEDSPGPGDNIVISGNYVSENGKYVKRSFIETAIKRIKDFKSQGKEDITWIIADSGYDWKEKMDMQNFASENGVKIMFIDDKEQLADYINQGKNEHGETIEERDLNKISSVTVFGHGSYLAYNNEFKLALGYEDEEKPALNISSQDLKNMKIDKNVFSSDSRTWFESCNTGTITEKSEDNKSFAQEWADETGSKTIALSDGRTNYEFINDHVDDREDTIWKWQDRYRRWCRGEDFTLNGSENYPVRSTDKGSENSQWKVYEKDKQPIDIDQSKIKEELGE
ncbi:hypothetical protein CLPUN_44720 [Clostridium puniceum]|uniref:Uncharacterized protein n=1 Tax=Clostridium puniceum TaxID=29367 RepID=A0A1S8T744_9CLOT|nr:hypothetical protein [Clostridium puniceum]OOM73576.1 hypothetical protein CLPUN_44720 [Clostridium puniceum]